MHYSPSLQQNLKTAFVAGEQQYHTAEKSMEIGAALMEIIDLETCRVKVLIYLPTRHPEKRLK